MPAHSPRILAPRLLVACFGNAMAGDDAFGLLVADRLRAREFSDAEIVIVGMQPFGLVHYLEENRQGLVIVDACQATQEIPAGRLLDVDFFGALELRLVHDLVLSTHGLSVANELELARKLNTLPPRVRLVTAAIESMVIGSPASPGIRELVKPAAERVVQIVMEWRSATSECPHA